MVGYRGNRVSRRMFMQMTAAMSAALAVVMAPIAATAASNNFFISNSLTVPGDPLRQSSISN